MWMTGEQQVFSGQQFQSGYYSSTAHKLICISSTATLKKFYHNVIKCVGMSPKVFRIII